MKLLSVLALLVSSLPAQTVHGLDVSGLPIILNSTRLADAQAYIIAHPWTPCTIFPSDVPNSMSCVEPVAAYGKITASTPHCDAAATNVLAYQIPLQNMMVSRGACTDHGCDPMRYYGTVVAKSIDYCPGSYTAPQRKLALDRWMGTTANASDPPHAFTAVLTANSRTITGPSGSFLANMAVNNMVIFTGTVGTVPAGCPCIDCANSEFMWPVLTVNSDISADLLNNPGYGPDYPATTNVSCPVLVGGYAVIATYNTWGGRARPWSNYFWGFAKNEGILGARFFNENKFGEWLLDFFFNVRLPIIQAFENGTSYTDPVVGVLDYTKNSSKGGIWNEGTEYGLAVDIYKTELAQYLRDCGLDFSEPTLSGTNWLRESAAFTLYNATRNPTSDQNGGTSYQQFPWDDDQATSDPTPGYPRGTLAYPAMASLSDTFGSANLGKYIRQWTNTLLGVGIAPTPWFPPHYSSTLALSDLPFDYYAHGPEHIFTKNGYGAGATQIKILGNIDRIGHDATVSGHVQAIHYDVTDGIGHWMLRGMVSYNHTGNADATVTGAGYAGGAWATTTSLNTRSTFFTGTGKDNLNFTRPGNFVEAALTSRTYRLTLTGVGPEVFKWGYNSPNFDNGGTGITAVADLEIDPTHHIYASWGTYISGDSAIGVVISNSATPVVHAVAHGLVTGNTVNIFNASGDWAAVNNVGFAAITKIDADHFSVAGMPDTTTFAGRFDSAGGLIQTPPITEHHASDYWEVTLNTTDVPKPTTEAQHSIAYNTLAYGPPSATGCVTGQGGNNIEYHPTTRLESKPTHLYAALDLTHAFDDDPSNPAFLSAERNCERNNPYAGETWREYLNSKSNDMLLLFQRMTANDKYSVNDSLHPVLAKADVVKSVYLHCPVLPTVSSGVVTCDNDGQRARMWSFSSDGAPDINIVNEGSFSGAVTYPAHYYNWRVEFSNKTAAIAHTAAIRTDILVAIKFGAISGWADPTVHTFTDNGDGTYTARFDHTSGNILWNIVKGASSSGGSFGYAASGTPAVLPLTSTVDGPTTDENGVRWPGTPSLKLLNSGKLPSPGKLIH